MTDAATLTIRHAQTHQPWTVPYSHGVMAAAQGEPASDTRYLLDTAKPPVPHILGSHCALHAMKSIGKIAAVYEKRDHRDQPSGWTCEQDRVDIRAAAADLMTAALRFANLEGFDLAEALIERVKEKNGTGYP
jgi:hypothetical protein